MNEELGVDDKLLIQKTLKGRLSAYESIVKKYEKLIYNYAFKILQDGNQAEDAAQEAFLKAYKNLKYFDLNKAFKPWILKITKNACFDIIRKLKKETQLSERMESDDQNLYDLVIQKEKRDLIKSEVEKLPDKYKEPLVEYYFSGLNYNEVAKKLKLPINTVRTRIRRAKNIIKKRNHEK